MESLWRFIAEFIEMVAKAGAGMASSSVGYEPELPEDLMN